MKKVAWISLLLLLAGCGPEHDETTLIETANPQAVQLDGKHDGLAAEIKKEADSLDEIYDTAVIKGTKQLLVAYKVRHFNRFQMKKIEKKVNEKVSGLAKNTEVVVSSDYKIFLELVRLKEDMQANKITEKEADKRLEAIVKLKREMT